jgi:hypothetical protein
LSRSPPLRRASISPVFPALASRRHGRC